MATGNTGELDLQGLTREEIDALIKQGIMPEQIAQYAQQMGQPIPPIVAEMLTSQMGAPAPGIGGPEMGQPGMGAPNQTSRKPGSMMSLGQYANYKKTRKNKTRTMNGAHEPNKYDYLYSDLEREAQEREMKQTQGSFLIGANIANLFNMFRHMIVDEERGRGEQRQPLNSDKIFKKTGEWVDVNIDNILDKEMGFRGSDVPLLPEKVLDQYSSFQDVLDESRKYATNQSGFDDEITPFGLLVMTRMLYKYRKNNAQWVRVATMLELIYKYMAQDGVSRGEFFKNKDEIDLKALLELEEFYNTDHLFMSRDELLEFKKNLDFYKYDPKVDIKMKIREIKKQAPQPPI